MYPWFQIKNKNKIGEIYVYGEITDDKWFDTDVTPVDVQEAVNTLKGTEEVNMYVNSPGGGVFAGMTIYNVLSRLPQKLTAYVDGLAASIASVITLAADTVYIPDTAMFMIHNPSGFAVGESDEMRRTADLLDQTKGMIVNVYKKKTLLSAKKLHKMMDAETWMVGNEAVDLGFADQLDDRVVDMNMYNDKCIVNGLKFDINKFKSFPSQRIAVRNRNKEDVRKLRERFNTLKTF